jgi:hydroxymethylbilane synthase
MKLRVGSRGSQLAVWQANHIAELLRGQGHSIEIEIIKTTGDRLQEVTFAEVGSKGMFTKEIEEALAAGRVDLAVHSLKDLPTELPEPFALAATPRRVDPRDAFVAVKYGSLEELPQGARVGTSSQRRRAQLMALRPDIEAVEFRGNVDTRLRKLGEGQVDGILLAAAGLERLGKTEWLRERMEPKDFCPAAGQGALGIETRKDDAATIAAVRFLDDAETRFAVTVEGERWVEIFAVVADPKTGKEVRVYHLAPRSESEPLALGRLTAEKLMEAGAGPLLAAADGSAL